MNKPELECLISDHLVDVAEDVTREVSVYLERLLEQAAYDIAREIYEKYREEDE